MSDNKFEDLMYPEYIKLLKDWLKREYGLEPKEKEEIPQYRIDIYKNGELYGVHNLSITDEDDFLDNLDMVCTWDKTED